MLASDRRERTVSRIEDRLRSLADLFDKGLLTRAEFEEQKRRIHSEPPASGTPPAAGVTPAVSGPGSAVAPPEAIGAYRVFAVVGAGGMGAVFRGRHRSEAMALRQGGDVAIKVMHPEFARRRAFQDRSRW
jgi:serine/threonine protein kinase